MVECLHVVLHTSRSQPDRLQALHRTVITGREQELHFADASSDREKRSLSKYSLPTCSQSLLSRIFRFHPQSRELLRSSGKNRQNGKFPWKSFSYLINLVHRHRLPKNFHSCRFNSHRNFCSNLDSVQRKLCAELQLSGMMITFGTLYEFVSRIVLFPYSLCCFPSLPHMYRSMYSKL